MSVSLGSVRKVRICWRAKNAATASVTKTSSQAIRGAMAFTRLDFDTNEWIRGRRIVLSSCFHVDSPRFASVVCYRARCSQMESTLETFSIVSFEHWSGTSVSLCQCGYEKSMISTAGIPT